MVWKKVLTLTVCTMLISTVFSATKICPKTKYCTCEIVELTMRYTVTCDGIKETKKLQYIPMVPPETTEVVFINNNLYNLSKETLKNLENRNITHLTLKLNSITFIQIDTFLNMHHLLSLDISGNPNIKRADTAKSFCSLPKRTITELKLNHLLWHPFPHMFDCLNDTAIYKIELSHSYLTPFDGKWFVMLKRLTILDISWNSIDDTNFYPKGLSSLKYFNLEGNWFNIVPDFCEYGLFNLTSLTLSRTKLYTIYHIRNYTECLRKLNSLNLNGLSLRIIPNNIFSKLESLQYLSMSLMSTQLTKIHPFAFNSSSLKSLTFSRADGFRFTKKMASSDKGFFDPTKLFKNLPNLVELDLSHNIIELSSITIKDMFSPLKNLKKIWLESLYLAYMPKNFFQRFPKLEYISLNKNILLPWDDESVFDGLMNLTELHLRNNKISIIHKSSFPESLLKSLQTLDLTYNQFSCTCDITWFSNWLDYTTVQVIGKTDYQCDNLKTRLIDYNPTFLDCHILQVSLSVGCGVGLLLVMTVTLYCCRWRIRYQLYSIRSATKHYKKLETNEFAYAAYIVYCYDDLKWVKDNLIPRIENEYGFKLCIPHRDFEVGKVFVDNIVENMALSRTVFAVLSNNFAKDEWCLFQLSLAGSKLTKEGNLSIFPILLEEIEFRNMNSGLYSLLKLSNYAAWEQNDNALDLFWDQVKDHL